MSLKLSFFPLHFIIVLLLSFAMAIVFNDTIYVYMASNLYLNGLILSLFIVCILWLLGVLSYYSRSLRVFNSLVAAINPMMVQFSKKDKKASAQAEAIASMANNPRKQAMFVASSISGTLIDSPIVSRVIANSMRIGKLDVARADADSVIECIESNGDRILGPSRFLTSIFTMLGLLGTFIGLLQTIDGVGKALGSLSDVANIDILGFVKLLADPLQGMSVAFSTSLFGLVGSLFGNYGNYVATQRLSTFVSKVKNLLAASAGMVSSDPNVIDAKDILVSLDDSFGRLYNGLAERLDIIADGIMVMSRAIVRTQERQEKVLKVIIDSFASMEEMWAYFPVMASSLKKLSSLSTDIEKIIEDNRIKTYEYVDNNFLVVLDKIYIENMKTNDMLLDLLELNDRSVQVSEDVASFTKDSSDGIAVLNSLSDKILKADIDSVEIAMQSNSALEKANELGSDLVGLNVRSNELGNAILSATVDEVNILSEIRGLSNSILSHNNDASNTIIRELVASNELSDALNQRTDVANNLLGASNELSDSLNQRADVSNSLLSALNESSDNTNGLLSNANDLSNTNNDLVSMVGGEVVNANSLLAESNMLFNNSNSLLDTQNQISAVSRDLLNQSNAVNSQTNDLLTAIGGELNVANSTLSGVQGSVDVSNSLATSGNDILNAIGGELNVVNSTLSGVQDSVGVSNSLAISGNDLLNAIGGELNQSNDLLRGIGALSETSNQLLSVGNSLYEVQNNLHAVGNDFLSNINYLLVGQSELLSSGLGEIYSVASEILNKIANEHLDSLGSIISGLNINNSQNDRAFALVNHISDLSEGILSALGDGLNNGFADLSNQLGQVNELSMALIQGMQDGNSLKAAIVSDVQMIVELNKQVLENMSSDSIELRSLVEDITTIRGLSGSMLDSLYKLDSSVSNVSSTVREVGEQSLSVLNMQGTYLVNLLDNANRMLDVSTEIYGQQDKIVESINKMSSDSDVVSANILSLKESFDNFAEGFTDIVENFQSNVESMTYVAGIGAELEQTMKELSFSIVNIAPYMGEMSEAINNGAYSMSSLMDVLESINTFSGDINNSLLNLDDGLMKISQSVYDSADLNQQSLDNINFVLEDIVNLANETNDRSYLLDSNLSNLISELGDMKALFADEMMLISQNMSSTLDNILDSFNFVSTNIEGMDTLAESLEALLSEISYAQVDARDMLQELRDNLSDIHQLQERYLNTFEGAMNTVDINVGDSLNLLNDRLELFQNTLDSHVDKLSGLDDSLYDLSGLSSAQVDTLADIQDAYVGLQNLVSDLSYDIGLASSNMLDVTEDIVRQTLAVERNAEATERSAEMMEKNFDFINDLSDSISDLAESNSSLRGVSENISDAANVFADFRDTLYTLQDLVDKQEKTFDIISSDLVEETKALSEILNEFNIAITDRKDSFNMENDMHQLSQDMSFFVGKFEEFNRNNSLDGAEVRDILNDMFAEVSDLRKSIVSNLGDAISKAIMESGLDAMQLPSNLKDNDDVVFSIEKLQDEYKNGTMRLDVIANAMDSLITEMLNSRDVAQSILNMVAEINSRR